MNEIELKNIVRRQDAKSLGEHFSKHGMFNRNTYIINLLCYSCSSQHKQITSITNAVNVDYNRPSVSNTHLQQIL